MKNDGDATIYRRHQNTWLELYFKKEALDTIATNEICLTEKYGMIVITRPDLDSRKTYKISNSRTMAFASNTDYEELVGDYKFVQKK